ncbi:chemotaxis protein CheW [Salinibaculum rarum]|uniref:chemotaxis protein CheW n=1 Tax=Salinibaculum rarum TaxID=3058903 RepID=UPI00265E132E|nr:chemotaxis protein CheW [Salinibaculum sp. KK48]
MTAAVAVPSVPEQVLEFTLGDEQYCLGIDRIEEIVRAEEITTLPNTSPGVAGVMDLRGETTTILDLTTVLSVHSDKTSQQVIILDSDERIGWLVDRVNRVSGLDDADIDSGPDSAYISGLISDGEEFVIWVDAEAVNESVSI